MDFRELLNKIDNISTEAKEKPRLTLDDVMPHVKELKFGDPLPSTMEYSIANDRDFQDKDIKDPQVRKALFVKYFSNKNLRGMLFSEIYANIKPVNDEAMEIGEHLMKIGAKMQNPDKENPVTQQEADFAKQVTIQAMKLMPLERDPKKDREYSTDDENSYESTTEGKKAKKDYDGDGKIESPKDEYMGSKDAAIKKAMKKKSKGESIEEGDNIYHDCVKSFKHNKFGEGEVLDGEHTLSEDGSVSHYDAKFQREDGSQFIVRNIPVANMHEAVTVEHGHASKKKKPKKEEIENVEEDWFQGQLDVTLNGDDFYESFGWIEIDEDNVQEAEYQGRSVKLNKPMRGDVKKFKVYVKNPKGNVVKVNFGDPDMRIKKSNPARRRSFRARHNCDNPGPKTKARYWSCKKW